MGSRTLRWLLPVTFTFFAANAVFTALLVPFLADRFGGRPGALAVLLSALGAGFLLGGPLAGRFVRDRPPRGPLTIGLAGVGACFAVLANAPTLPVAILAAGLAGLPASLLLITVSTTIQRATPAPLLGRVGGTFYTCDAAAGVVGALVGAALGHPAALPTVLTGSAVVILLCAVVTPMLVRDPVDRDRRWSVRGIFGSNVDGGPAGQRPAGAAGGKSSPSAGI
jgi:predicted MFS family arabinose efflux permease